MRSDQSLSCSAGTFWIQNSAIAIVTLFGSWFQLHDLVIPRLCEHLPLILHLCVKVYHSFLQGVGTTLHNFVQTFHQTLVLCVDVTGQAIGQALLPLLPTLSWLLYSRLLLRTRSAYPSRRRPDRVHLHNRTSVRAGRELQALLYRPVSSTLLYLPLQRRTRCQGLATSLRLDPGTFTVLSVQQGPDRKWDANQRMARNKTKSWRHTN